MSLGHDWLRAQSGFLYGGVLLLLIMVLGAGAVTGGARLAFDIDSNPVALFPSEWSLGYFSQNHPNLTLTSLAPPRLHTR
jgi:hypothetical protein